MIGTLGPRNVPASGSVGMSGMGREVGQEGIDEYLWTKTVASAALLLVGD